MMHVLQQQVVRKQQLLLRNVMHLTFLYLHLHALAELVTRPDTEEVIARALAAPAEAGEDPLRGVYLETFCAWLPELSRMAGV